MPTVLHVTALRAALEDLVLVDPRLSVCQLSLPDTTFEEDLALIAAAGAVGVSIAELKIPDGEDDHLIAALAASGLTPTIAIPVNVSPLPMRPPYIFPGPEDVDERVELMCASVRRLARTSTEYVAVLPGSAQGYRCGDAWQMAVDGIRAAADVAADHGTKLAFEICRTDLGTDFSFMRTIPEAMAFLDEVDRSNVGFLYDVYHLWDTENVLEHTERFAERVVAVQYSDWRHPPLHGADRVLPGDGIIDLPAILGALERGGFTGWYDLEIFSDDGRWGAEVPDSLWKMPCPELLARAHAGFRAAWQARR